MDYNRCQQMTYLSKLYINATTKVHAMLDIISCADADEIAIRVSRSFKDDYKIHRHLRN